MNKVGSESLNRAVAKAAENIIDTKGVTALVSDALHDDLQDDSIYLPPCHTDAAKPEDVYKFEDRILLAAETPLHFPSWGVRTASPSEPFRNVTSEEILKMIEENSHCSSVIEALKSLPSNEESRDRQARCPGTWSPPHHQHQTTKAIHLPDLQQRQAKVTAYVIVLALHINDFQIDLTMLQRDLKLSEKRMMEIAKAMRLKISKRKVSLAAGGEEEHRLGTLSIPLPPAQTLDRQSKRRKIT
ncbi:POLR1E [Cervus elaphus hippelaphus]|uniref:POLR1E n=1 Tax=Cervus elaphus hippelaphus TaxID=46360 RepID=A0A212C5G4_CEREH|nr:POLR1E [Cervus elaphus hippelaphus]